MKIVELITSLKAYEWSPEDFQSQHPYFTMGQIHSALAYYWDRQETRGNGIVTMTIALYMDEHIHKSITTGLRQPRLISPTMK